MGIKMLPLKKDNVPGPGEYNSKKDFGAPQFSMGAKLQVLKDKVSVPGPGNYAPVTQSSLSAAPRYGFGTSKRKPINDKNDTPGPGNYKVPTKVAELPQYAGPKNDEFKFV